MKTVRNACTLQPKALDIHVGDQIEQLDQIINDTHGAEYFAKTFITDGMRTLLSKGIARLAARSNDTVFHLKQAMGGGKTHLMVGFGLLAKDAELRRQQIGTITYHDAFASAKIAAFNGRNNPHSYIWGEIAGQLGREGLFRPFWENGAKAPEERDWLKLFEGDEPILILLDEMPPYFHYYSTQTSGDGTIADIITRAFANMLTAAQKKKNVCIVVSDLDAAYDTGGKLIQRALDDATQELGRAEVSITPVNLESNEIYEILRKRLFKTLPNAGEIAEVAAVYAKRLAEAAKARTVERSAEALANDIEATYPFHPSFKSIVALFKENEKFKQTRGLMELVSRLLKSVWESNEDIYLIGAQHFDLSLPEVRDKLAEISQMRDVIAKDLWDSTESAHAQVIDLAADNTFAKQSGTLLLTASLSTAINSIKGLSEPEMLECLIDPIHQGSDYRASFVELEKSAWYLHKTKEGRYYFDHQENLTKKLEGYAEKAPQNRVDELVRHRLNEMFKAISRDAYEKVLALPEMDDAEAAIKSGRTLLIISPDGRTPPSVVQHFFNHIVNKNNLLVLTGERSSIASVEKAARHVYAVTKADDEISATHPQRKELDEKITQYRQDFESTVLAVFDRLHFPGHQAGKDLLRSKLLDATYPANEPYNGERQIIKTLTADPIKLYTDISANFDALKARAESLLFGNQNEVRRTDLIDRMRQKPQMPWLPPKGFDQLTVEAYQRGLWEDLGNGLISKTVKAKTTEVLLQSSGEPDDEGWVRLSVEATNAGNHPRIHYAEDGLVSENSPVLKDNTLDTKALKVQFLAVDLTGKNLTGPVVTWTNKLVLRTDFDETNRRVVLKVAPKIAENSIRYTLDGSEPRNGTSYAEPIILGKEATTIHAFAEVQGIEAKREFKFPEAGSNEIPIQRDKPADLVTPRQKQLSNAGKTYEGIKLAKERKITFEQVMLMIGSAPQAINLALGEITITAEYLEETLAHLQKLLPPNAPVILKFKRLHAPTGFDLEEFVKTLGIEVAPGEVVQDD